MKSIKKILLSVCCIAALLSSGCNNKTYSIYTNMPDGSFEITDKSYKTAEIIDGYSSDNVYDEFDASEYTGKSARFYAMTADAQLVIYSDFAAEGSEETFNYLTKAVSAKLYEIEKAISASVTNSDIYNFNIAQAGEKLQIRQITYEVMKEAKEVYAFTDGYYNPALFYNIEAYGFGNTPDYPEKSSDLPDDELIAKYTDLASHFSDIVLEEIQAEDQTAYYITKPAYTVEAGGEVISMKLDLGGIGKGYAVDCVDKLIENYGYKFGYFNFGTSSMLVKNNPGDGSFSLGLSSPRSPSRSPYLTTSLRNEKLSSSGDYEQFYFIDGTRYCHIISPKTGKPVQTGIMSATVIGGSAASADALTTAIMAMEKDDAIKFVREKLSDRRVVFTFE